MMACVVKHFCVAYYLPKLLLESKSVFCGGVVEGGGRGVDCRAEYRFRPAVRDKSATETKRDNRRTIVPK